MAMIRIYGSLALGLAIVCLWGCAGEIQTGACSDGEIIDEYICEGGEWVLYDGPCIEVDCGSNGVCTEDDGEARCSCDSGYVEEGQNCVAEEEEDACAGVDCDGQGSCSVSGGEAQCDCQAGFESDGLSCVEVAPGACDDLNCGTHGNCVEVDEQATCDCLEGYIEVDYRCDPEEVDPCESFDCGPNGACVQSGENASCNCDAGFEDENDYCVDPLAPCDGVTCSDHGSCEVAGGSPQCNCENGYEAAGLQCVEEPPQCVGASECAVYVLQQGATSYERVDYQDTGLYEELDGPIVAAFGIENTYRAYVLTETSYFRVNTNSNFAPQISGPLSAIHPDIASIANLQGVFGHTSSAGGDITFLRNTSMTNHGDVRILSYSTATGSFEEHENTDLHQWIDITWDETLITGEMPPTNQDYRAFWLDLNNERDFAQGSFQELCDDPDQSDNMDGVPYVGVLSQETIHYQIPGACATFVDAEDAADSAIFGGFANGPDYEDIGAAIWKNGALYLFTQGYYE